MIHIFRKEMKKWKAILWVVFISMVAGSGASFFMFRQKSIEDVFVAKVNGNAISFKTYRSSLIDIQKQISILQEYARKLGLSESIFLKSFLGSSNPYETALSNCIKDELIDQVKKQFSIKISPDYFQKEFMRSIPSGIIDESGRINLDSYRAYLDQFALTPALYEARKEEEFKRQLIDRFVVGSYYTPTFYARSSYLQNNQKKRFAIAQIPLESFEQQSKRTAVSDDLLRAFFEENKQKYRVPEKRKARYWNISAKDYAKIVEISDEAVERFYNANKSSLFRLPAQIKVRSILIQKDKKDDDATDAFKKAQEVYEKVKQNPDSFADLAKQYSQDSKTAKRGGLTDFFKRGTMDEQFEKAAFRLNNKGDVSDIVQTKEGFTIIKLEDRIQATEKPLDEVREEVVKALQGKRAVSTLKSDLEMIMHTLKSNPSALAEFIAKFKAKPVDSEWLIKENNDLTREASSFNNSLTQRVFSLNKTRNDEYGYFFDADTYTIYQFLEVQESFLPPLESIKSEVSEHYYKKEAKRLMKESISKAKLTIFGKQMSLADIAKANGYVLVQTDFIKRGDEIKGIEDSKELSRSLALLTDPSHVIYHKKNKKYYLAQLIDQEPIDEQKFIESKIQLIGSKKMRNAPLHARAFIASLQRNAKIDINESVMKSYQGK